ITYMVHQQVFRGLLTFRTVGTLGLLLLLPAGILGALYAGTRPFSRIAQGIGSLFLRPEFGRSPTFTRMCATISNSEAHAETLFRKNPKVLVQAIAVSLLNWGCIIIEFWVMFFVLGVKVPAGHLLIIITVARLAFLTPLPGGLGALEAGQVFILELLHLQPALGLSVCILIRIRDVIVGGLGFLLLSRFLAHAEES
ncbi:hypothetical protein GF339_04080, partial [candidate division KSB3 bacterium]|nr:hypothetical protein [candidate division KSB3 bacterium]MBD3323738.1 hypothetical protein [candidate division KSB3 bacterium]